MYQVLLAYMVPAVVQHGVRMDRWTLYVTWKTRHVLSTRCIRAILVLLIIVEDEAENYELRHQLAGMSL